MYNIVWSTSEQNIEEMGEMNLADIQDKILG